MNNIFNITFLFLLFNCLISGTLIRGNVIDQFNKPIAYANIYIKNSFDGTSSDEKGQFLFETDEKGEKQLALVL